MGHFLLPRQVWLTRWSTGDVVLHYHNNRCQLDVMCRFNCQEVWQCQGNLQPSFNYNTTNLIIDHGLRSPSIRSVSLIDTRLKLSTPLYRFPCAPILHTIYGHTTSFRIPSQYCSAIRANGHDGFRQHRSFFCV